MRIANLTTLDGAQVEIDSSTIESSLGGEIAYPDSPGYAEARALWNAMIERRPGLIVRPRTEDDVVRAVRFARERNLLTGVKGGGHNIAGKALVEGGLVIDFALMRGVHVDPVRRIARVQPGATLGDLDKATQQHALLVPVGVNSTTGIAGLTLGGGFGWATRKYGLTIDNLRRARLVTAAGEALDVDADAQPDLFWAIRGGGGNFGIVTEFEFALNPGGPEVLAGMVVHPFANMRKVVSAYQQAVDRAPEELSCWMVLRKAPPLPFLPEEWHGREIAVLAMCHVGEIAAGERAASELRSIGEPIADIVGPMPYAGWQTAFDPLLAPGARNYWKSHDVASFGDASLDVVEECVTTLPTEECEILLGHLGGAMTRVGREATAWPNREEHFAVNIHTRWRDPQDDERCRDWARRIHGRLEPHAMGSLYINFVPEGDEDRIAAAYGPNLARLASIKRRVDPDNFFRANQNIAPAG